MTDIIRNMTPGENWKLLEVKGDSGLTFAAEERAGKLPVEVVENIIVRIPFPSLFKARLLSRAWYFNFPPAPRCVKSLSPSVQNLVSSVSSKWPTYCPCYVAGSSSIIGFDRTFARWQTLMDISHLPVLYWTSVTSAGPLLCVTSVESFQSTVYGTTLDVFVPNAITRSWTNIKLHFPVQFDESVHVVVKIILEGSHGYKVLRVSVARREGSVCVSIHDSRFGTKPPNIFTGARFSHIYRASAYLDGKLYCIFKNEDTATVSLGIYNVQNNAWSPVPSQDLNGIETIADCGVLLCGDKVMVTVCIIVDEGEIFHNETVTDEANEGYGFFIPARSIRIHELDVGTLELKPVPKISGPPFENIYGVGLRNGRMNFASDSNFIYFGQNFPGTAVLRYNIHSDEWDCIPPAFYGSFPSCGPHAPYSKPWMTTVFQPGLFPFMMV